MFMKFYRRIDLSDKEHSVRFWDQFGSGFGSGTGSRINFSSGDFGGGLNSLSAFYNLLLC